MGNLPLSTSFFKTDSTTSDQVITERFIARKIRSGVIYYYSPVTEAGSEAVCPAKDFRTSGPPCLISSLSPTSPPVSDLSDSSSSPPISETASHMTVFSQKQSYSSSRPLLVFFSWLGARPDAVAKYRDLYLDRDMDVLLIQSSVIHFLWPRWGLSYGLEVLSILEEPSFSNRAILVHASSIGGYTFTQMLSHVAQEPKRHACLAQRVVGHIYDSLVVGSLEHMATGLGKTLIPRLEGFIRNMAMFYFWLFKAYTADLYERSIHVFYNSPVTSPALFFFCENDVMCSPAVLGRLMDFWKQRGVAISSRKWEVSTHAAHLRCHPEEYVSTLQNYLNSLPTCSLMPKM
uniref:Uncharacterized protein n=4 Tax=Nothobranchius TaxID=28779 RepID=A0A1A8QPB8_9TELE